MPEATHKGEEGVVGSNPKRAAAMEALTQMRTDQEVPIEPIDEEEDNLPIEKGDDGKYYARITIDGHEELLPFEDVIANAQKVKASSKRFEEAAALRAQLEAEREEFEKIKLTKPAPPPEQDEDDDELDKLIQEYHKALYDDDEDAAVKLMKQIRGRSKTTPFASEDAVRKMVQDAINEETRKQEEARSSREQREFMKSVKSAQAKFEETYPEIANDSVLRSIADAKTVEIMEADDTLKPWDVIQKAAEATLEWVSNKTVGGNRSERKRSAEHQPNPASVSGSLGSDEQPVTRSDVINELRHARHQKS